MARTRKRGLWVDTELTYATDPSASGAGYLWVPALEIGDLTDGQTPLETDYFTGRNFSTAPIAGPDGWSFTCTVPIIGMAAAAGDGVSPGADDWLDAFLTHIHGTQNSFDGEGVASVPDSSGIVVDADDNWDAEDMMPVFEAGVPSAATRTQWCQVTADNGAQDYDIAPNWTTNPTGAAIIYGYKQYLLDDDGGAPLSFVYRQDDLDYTLLGGRCTSVTLTGEAGKIWRMSLAFRGDNRTQESKGSLPTSGVAPSNTPTIATLSPIWFNGTNYATRQITIEYGLQTAVQESTLGTNGRANDENISATPMVTVEPLYTDALLELRRQATSGRLLVQIGGGVLSGGVLNTCSIAATQATAIDANPQDENGRIRNSLQLRCTDSGASGQYFQFARA